LSLRGKLFTYLWTSPTPGGWEAIKLGGWEDKMFRGQEAGRPREMSEDRWKRLDVWKLADELAYKTYLVSRKFPKEEIYGLTSQRRRAALSIPTNIVESYSRKGDKQLAHFVNISLGSMAETKYLLYFAHRLGLLPDEEYDKIKKGYEELGRKLWRFYESVQNR
jgi:four helix bundle protein